MNESANLTGLSPSTTYHYRIEATNNTGTSYGTDQTFTTPASSPSYSDTVLGTPGLLGYWRLGEQSGTTAVDATGSNNGTYVGGSTLGQPGALASDSDTSASFDGSTGRVSLPNSVTLPVNSPVTVEFWAYVSSADVGNRSAFTIGNLDAPNRVQAHVPWSDGNLYWDYGTYSAGRVSTSYASYLNKWTYVTLVSDGSGRAFPRHLSRWATRR